MPGSTAGQLTAFYEARIDEADLCEVVGDARTDDAATDDYGINFFRNAHGCNSARGKQRVHILFRETKIRQRVFVSMHLSMLRAKFVQPFRGNSLLAGVELFQQWLNATEIADRGVE